MQCPGGKSRQQSAGRNILLSQPADQLNGVEGSAAPADIVAAVEAAGYGASPKNAAAQSAAPSADALKDTETPRLKRRLIASLIFWVVLMYFSMGHMLWNWPLPGFMQGNHVAMGILQMLLTIIIMVINQKFFYQRL